MSDKKISVAGLRHFGASLAIVALLTACGGGGGARSTPAPTPTPTPSPTPSPTPTPTPPPPGNFDTAEFRRSDGPDFHGAVTAWQGGNTGQGETIAVIDTGIDVDSPEFAGRLHPDSQDVASNRGANGEDDHGTHVAMIAAAARDDTGILGIAFDATVLALRADNPGSCNPASGGSENSCEFFDSDIATGVDQAIASGAAVINISLGGGAASQVLLSAIGRAANAGIVVVVSAGNDGDGSNPDIPPDQPDPFASSLVQAGNGNVIIAGSVDINGQFSSFSNQAGSFASSYLAARGEEICCIYEDGELVVTTDAMGNQFVTVFNGTSFSAPQISGAVALLAQAFPNLTAVEIVDILLDSARDAGAAGPDAVYGSGILDIAAAFQPQGVTTLAGSTTMVALGADTAVGSTAMGDALAGQGTLSAVLLDKYQRAYNYDLSLGMRGALSRQQLHAAVDAPGRRVSASSAGLSMAFTIGDRGPEAERGWSRQLSLTSEDADKARVLAGRVAARIAPDTQIGFAFSEGAQGLVAQLQGSERPAFLIAGSSRGDSGFAQGNDVSLALRQQLGSWGVTLSAEQGEAWLGNWRSGPDVTGLQRENFATRSLGLSVDRRFGPVRTTLGLSWLDEDRTVLGGYFHEALGGRGAETLFVDAGLGVDLGSRWRLGAEVRRGYTKARRGQMIAMGSNLTSRGWSIDLVRTNIWQRYDSLGLRVSQPLRVESGGLLLNLPLSYDYASESPIFGLRALSLAPDGRELTGEISWHGWLWNGGASASVFYRNQPGHIADAQSDAGVAFKWSKDF